MFQKTQVRQAVSLNISRIIHIRHFLKTPPVQIVLAASSLVFSPLPLAPNAGGTLVPPGEGLAQSAATGEILGYNLAACRAVSLNA